MAPNATAMTTACTTSACASALRPAPSARDRRRYAATDPAVGHHRHQHEKRKDERDAGDGAGSEETHEIGLRDTDERLQRKHGENGPGEFEKRARYRPFEERDTSHEYAPSSLAMCFS